MSAKNKIKQLLYRCNGYAANASGDLGYAHCTDVITINRVRSNLTLGLCKEKGDEKIAQKGSGWQVFC